jgi:hypothetical protein
MEGDIILGGFLEAESKHGLRYMRLVGDEDSSVFRSPGHRPCELLSWVSVRPSAFHI